MSIGNNTLNLQFPQESNDLLVNSTTNSTALINYENELHRIGRIILLLLFTANIMGNLSVLLVMWGTGRKKRMRFFIMNLAITDLFVAIGGILPELILNATVQFYAPEAICRLVKYMSATATYASSFALVILSFDRAEAVIKPLRSTKKTCFGVLRPRGLAICGWAAASICGIPGLALSHLVDDSVHGRNCYINFKLVSPRGYFTSVAVTVFILPALFITVCHVVMVVRIWQASSHSDREIVIRGNPSVCVKKTRRAIDTIGRDYSTCGEDDVVQASGKFGRLGTRGNEGAKGGREMGGGTVIQITTSTGCIPRARIKTVKMTLVIVSVYIICWCPYMIYNLLVTYSVIGHHTPKLMEISPLIQHLVTLNSSANPIIFWIFSAHTIINERKKNRRSKVVQRQRRRWKYNSGNRVWSDHPHNRNKNQTEQVLLVTRRGCYPNSSNRLAVEDRVDKIGFQGASELTHASSGDLEPRKMDIQIRTPCEPPNE